MIISDLHSALKPYLDTTPAGQLFVLADDNTAAKCMPHVFDEIAEKDVHMIIIPASESSKSIFIVQQVWDELFVHHATREALLINVGGGVVTDLGGFVAATYMRGIRYVNIPTSLLAMVDASSGGKTGINYREIKNLIGTFTLPSDTFIYLPFLDTLPVDDWLSGYAEMLKHGLLDNKEQLDQLLSLEIDHPTCIISSELLSANIAVKERIVLLDPTEKGVRKLLNFGHTIGHAIEEAYAADGRTVKHGYCVLWGMVAELYLSVIRLGFPVEILSQISHVMLEYYGRPECDCHQRNKLIEWMLRDKKNKVLSETGKCEITFSLLRDIGVGVMDQIVTDKDIDEALEYLFSL